jgi:hypothetical protein
MPTPAKLHGIETTLSFLANRRHCNHRYSNTPPTCTFERNTKSAISAPNVRGFGTKGSPCLTLERRLDERVSQALTPARLVGNHVSNNTGSELKQRDCLMRSSPLGWTWARRFPAATKLRQLSHFLELHQAVKVTKSCCWSHWLG